MSGTPFNQQTSIENDQDHQRQELECLSSLLTDEEFHPSSTSSGEVLEVFPMLSEPVQILAIPKERLDEFEAFIQSLYGTSYSKETMTEDNADLQLGQYRVASVRHLPPVRIVFRYPSTYPSDSPPEITLSCDWMENSTLRFLESRASDLWKHNGRLPVMYDIYEFMRNILDDRKLYPLGHFLILIPEDRPFVKCGGNVVLAKNTTADIERLISYNKQREENVFARELQQCPVCFESHSGKNLMKLRNCGHFCCTPCLRNNCETQIAEGLTRLVNCLMCQAELHPSDVSDLISEEKQDKYHRLQLDSPLTRMGDVVYCPRPQCNAVVIKDGDIGQCQCGFTFCTLCHKSTHGIEPCSVYTAEANQPRWPEGDTDENYLRNRLLATVMGMGLMDTIKKCPGCVTYIQKMSGCNHVVCRCGQHFCWGCLARLPKEDPYAHFRSVENPQCFDATAGRFGDIVPNTAAVRAIEDLADELLPTPERWFDEREVRNQLQAALARHFQSPVQGE